MRYDTIHHLKVNNLLVGVSLRDKSTGIFSEAYGVPQRRLVTKVDNNMAKLLEELNKRFSEFGFQFESNTDAPLLLFNFLKGDDNSNTGTRSFWGNQSSTSSDPQLPTMTNECTVCIQRPSLKMLLASSTNTLGTTVSGLPRSR